MTPRCKLAPWVQVLDTSSRLGVAKERYPLERCGTRRAMVILGARVAHPRRVG